MASVTVEVEYQYKGVRRAALLAKAALAAAPLLERALGAEVVAGIPWAIAERVIRYRMRTPRCGLLGRSWGPWQPMPRLRHT